jgi:hypothetical protein
MDTVDKDLMHKNLIYPCVHSAIYSDYIVNTCATLGLFLWEYFEKKYKPALKNKKAVDAPAADDKPINLDDIPF